MAVYKNDSGNWYVKFMHEGQIYTKSTGGKNKAKALELEAKMRAEIREGKLLGNSPDITLGDAINNHLQHIKNHKRACNHKSIAKWWLSHAPKKMVLSSITTKWVHDMVARKQGEGVGNATLLQYCIFLRMVCKLSEQLGYKVGRFICPKIRVKNNRLRFLTTTEEQKLLEALVPEVRMATYINQSSIMRRMAQDDYDLVCMLLDTGARLNEIQTLKWENINFDENTIHLYRSKVDNESMLVMTFRTKSILQRRFDNKRNEWVFNARDGGPRKNNIGIRHVLDKLGMKDVSLHILRHTVATKLIRNGMPVQEVQCLLGHTDIQTTMRYAHVDTQGAVKKTAIMLNELNVKV